ncbi:MAG: hypothetical protein IKD69_01140 [Solobacterium sp.]|nr:hypothetical protein [Solobacterium sp.]
MTWNLTYAMFNGILGVSRSSWWFLTMGAFYLLIGMMRIFALSMHVRSLNRNRKLLKYTGIGIILAGIVLSWIVGLSIRFRHNPIRSTGLMVVIAGCTFGLVGNSIRNVIKAQRQKSAVMITVRNIACVSAIVSLFSLERAMLRSFGTASWETIFMMESISGGTAMFIVALIGVSMIIQSRKYEDPEKGA